MSDLISRSALINKIRGIVPGSQDVDFIVNMIENQPTAYDVEKVVADLEYQKEQCEKDMKYYEEKSWKDHISHTNYDLFYAKSDCLEDAIDIVKRGVCDD